MGVDHLRSRLLVREGVEGDSLDGHDGYIWGVSLRG